MYYAMPTTSRAIQTFEVSLKAALFSGGQLLFLQESDTGFWELPGGRIDVGEERLSHDAILAREIREELGEDVRFTATPRSVSFVRQRPTDSVFQFILVRVCRFDGGSLNLSAEHHEPLWLDALAASKLNFPPLSDYHSAVAKLFELQP
jgi:8-oxo-dGTP pyrophosphatase MutT (NUDIX family)